MVAAQGRTRLRVGRTTAARDRGCRLALYLAPAALTLRVSRGSRPLPLSEGPSVVLGAVLAGSGLWFFYAGTREFRSFEQMSDTKAGHLMTGGPYRYSRNPQVVGWGWCSSELHSGVAHSMDCCPCSPSSWFIACTSLTRNVTWSASSARSTDVTGQGQPGFSVFLRVVRRMRNTPKEPPVTVKRRRGGTFTQARSPKEEVSAP